MSRAPLLLPILLLVGCDSTAETVRSEVSSDTSEGWWRIGPTDEDDVRNALSVCLSIIREEAVALTILNDRNWREREFPASVDNTSGKTIFGNEAQSELIALGSDKTFGSVCSVLSAANHTMLTNAVDSLDQGFQDGLTMLPHGPYWTANGISINNDYANNHVFEPQIFDPNDFFESRISDIRIQRCKELC